MDEKEKEAVQNLSISILDFFTNGSGTIAKNALEVYLANQARIFNDKAKAFLKGVGSREEIKNKLQLTTEDEASAFFKRLWNLVDQVEEEEKMPTLNNLLRSAINGKITLDQFFEASDVIKRTYFGYLKSLKHEHLVGNNSRASNATHRQQLILNGLLNESPPIGINKKLNQGGMFKYTDIGKLVSDHLDIPIQSSSTSK